MKRPPKSLRTLLREAAIIIRQAADDVEEAGYPVRADLMRATAKRYRARLKELSARVIVQVNGGNVSAVYASDAQTSVEILDYDNLKGNTASEAIADGSRLEAEVAKLHEISV